MEDEQIVSPTKERVEKTDRRGFLKKAGVAAAGAVVASSAIISSCSNGSDSSSTTSTEPAKPKSDTKKPIKCRSARRD